jgi:hypothetical protein
LLSALVALAGSARIARAEDAPSTAPVTDPNPVSARWATKKIDFVYMGFTAHYSCDGLLDKVRPVLLQLGARKQDLSVHERGCTAQLGRPDPFPGVAGTFSVLEPAAAAGATPSPANPGEPVAAHWKHVRVKVAYGVENALDTAGQCELIEQIKYHILPLFTTQNVKYRSSCIPHDLQLGTMLEADVLMPDAKPGAPSTARNGG